MKDRKREKRTWKKVLAFLLMSTLLIASIPEPFSIIAGSEEPGEIVESGGNQEIQTQNVEIPEEVQVEIPESENPEPPEAEVLGPENLEPETPEVEFPGAEYPGAEYLGPENPEPELPEAGTPEAVNPEAEAPKVELPETELQQAQPPEAEIPETETPKEELSEILENSEKLDPPVCSMDYEDSEVKITASAECEGVIPADTTLQVIPIRSDLQETAAKYQEVSSQLERKAEGEEYDIAGFLAYDISFVDADGREVEPNGAVRVAMEYKEAMLPEGMNSKDTQDANVTVMHLEENQEGQVTGVVDLVADSSTEAMVSTTEEQEVMRADFVTDRFSTFTLTWNYQYGLIIDCYDGNGVYLAGRTPSKSIKDATEVADLAPIIDGYVFSGRALIGNGTAIQRLRHTNSGWQYHTSKSGNSGWINVGNNRIRFIYKDSSEDQVKVYVYVASQYTVDGRTYSWTDNEEFKELIGLTKCDDNAYFPAGEITLDREFLTGKNYNTPGAPLITGESDWTALMAALGAMDTSNLCDSTEGGEFAANQGNHVGEYLSQAFQDVGYNWGSQHTALFRWSNNPSYGFKDQTVQYHLDLRFNTNTIQFLNADTEEQIDYRTYITGSKIQEPRNLNIPAGYQLVGYFNEKACTTPWYGIGTPLNEDKIVYVKIAKMEDVVINYVNVSGEKAGTLSNYDDILNPVTGVPEGSMATAKKGYSFAGWYAERDCTHLLSTAAEYIPTRVEGETWKKATYYAKFDVHYDAVDHKVRKTWANPEEALSSVEVELKAYVDDNDAGATVDAEGNLIPLELTNAEYSFLPQNMRRTLSGSNEWQYLWQNLPRYYYYIKEGDEKQAEIRYTAIEIKTEENSGFYGQVTETVEDDIPTTVITNRNKTKTVEDKPLIEVSKTFRGLTKAQVEKLAASYQVTVENVDTHTTLLTPLMTNLDQNLQGSDADRRWTYTWQLEDCDVGTYKIVENGHQLDGYNVSTMVNGTQVSDWDQVTVTAQAATITYSQTARETTCAPLIFKVGTVNLIVAKLTQNEGYFVWTSDRASVNDRLAIVNLINNEISFSPTAVLNKCYFFSGDDINDTLTFRDGTIAYDGRDELHFDASKQWSMFATGTYTLEEGNRAEVDIDNTYTPKEVYSLPSAGGSGIYWYSIGGVLLMLAAALILYRRKVTY